MTELENVEQLTITYSNLKNSLDYAVKLGNTSENILKMVIGLPLENEIILSDNLSGLTLKKIFLLTYVRGINIATNLLMQNFVFFFDHYVYRVARLQQIYLHICPKYLTSSQTTCFHQKKERNQKFS